MSKKYKYEIEIEGDGGEFIAAEVEHDFLEALDENGIDIEEYAEGDSADERFACIPEDIRPFDPGEWYNLDRPIAHATLALASAKITVWDKEAGEFIFNSHEDEVQYNYDEDIEFPDQPKDFSIYDPDPEWFGKAVYTCQRHEDGTFFIAELELDEPFDASKLLAITPRFNDEHFINELAYYPQGIGNGDYILIRGEFGGSDINGATHELMQL